jgi:hypothetical protein
MGDNLPSAADKQQQYHRQENPAKHDIYGGAVGTLGRLLGTSFFLPRTPQRPGPFRAALSAFVAEEQALGDVGDQSGTASL